MSEDKDDEQWKERKEYGKNRVRELLREWSGKRQSRENDIEGVDNADTQ